ncbi:MAG: YbaK/EbsC family protein [Armatimonadota bacterium]|nr:YbaK/EbsC family protein [Armatimonadota bacterium]
MSRLFGQTLRAAPAEVRLESYRLLLRAGYVRPLAAATFGYLPLGVRVIRRIEQVLRGELEAIGGQEVVLPLPAPFEEAVARLAQSEVHSYRQLPRLLYRIRTGPGGDSPGPGGPLRTGEAAVVEAATLEADEAGLERQHPQLFWACDRLFRRVGLPGVIAVAANGEMTGESRGRAFVYLTEIGEETVVLCDRCGYAATRRAARCAKPIPQPEAPRPAEPVATPHAETIAALAQVLGVPPSRTAKVVLYQAAVPGEGVGETREVLVMGIVRGDMSLDEGKLARAIGARRLRPAAAEAIRAAGAVPGYASPVGLARGSVLVVVDDLVAASANLVAGANREGFHLRNVNVGRDFLPDAVVDLVEVQEGAPCVRCGQALRLVQGVEVGHIRPPGAHLTQALGAYYVDAEGQRHPVVMGSCGIDIGRLLECLAEAHHDSSGLRWPASVAPYEVHLVRLAGREPEVAARSDELYVTLTEAGVEVLYDDREGSAGVKFTDADLIGLPLRLTVSGRTLRQGGVELKARDEQASRLIPWEGVLAAVRQDLERRRAAAVATRPGIAHPEAEMG